VEIPRGSGNRYRYRYNPSTKVTEYLGPSGGSPEISEQKFLNYLGETPIWTTILGKHGPITMADFQEFIHQPDYELETDLNVMHGQEIEWKNWPLMESLKDDMEKEEVRILFERERRRRGKMGEVTYWKPRRGPGSGPLDEPISVIKITENLIPMITEYGMDAGNETIAHEFGHYIEQRHGLMSEHIGNDVLGTYNEERRFYDGIFGMHNPAEAWAEGVSVYYNNPDDLKSMYPDAYEYIDRTLKELDLGQSF
jgi:hypothetical protein